MRLIGARGWPPGEPRPARGRVGVLGGAFNPAHAGHVQISLLALKALGLDEVWWLVTPRHPMKRIDSLAPFARRCDQARRRCAPYRNIRVRSLESFIPSDYTFRTVMFLKDRGGSGRFVWLMGADNLIQVHRWRHWRVLFRTVPVAVFHRPGYGLRARCGVAARVLRRRRLAEGAASRLCRSRLPRWVFLSASRHPASASAIRRRP